MVQGNQLDKAGKTMNQEMMVWDKAMEINHEIEEKCLASQKWSGSTPDQHLCMILTNDI